MDDAKSGPSSPYKKKPSANSLILDLFGGGQNGTGYAASRNMHL
jgi:hypothetical protein